VPLGIQKSRTDHRETGSVGPKKKPEGWALPVRRIPSVRSFCGEDAVLSNNHGPTEPVPRKKSRTDGAGPSGANIIFAAFHIFPDTRAFSLPLCLSMNDADVVKVYRLHPKFEKDLTGDSDDIKLSES
jgi:hypothetical protein